MANIWHSLQLLRGGFSYLKRNKEYIRARARARARARFSPVFCATFTSEDEIRQCVLVLSPSLEGRSCDPAIHHPAIHDAATHKDLLPIVCQKCTKIMVRYKDMLSFVCQTSQDPGEVQGFAIKILRNICKNIDGVVKRDL